MPDGYAAGSCNIGSAEIARRRRIGHVGVAATIALLVVLVVGDAHPGWRLLIGVPASGAAAGYLQAALRFCFAFGMAGVFNFGDLGTVERVEDGASRRADRRKALRLSLASAAIGLGFALISLVL